MINFWKRAQCPDKNEKVKIIILIFQLNPMLWVLKEPSEWDGSFEHTKHMGRDARNPVFGGLEQQRRRPACASAQSDQPLFYSLIGKCNI